MCVIICVFANPLLQEAVLFLFCALIHGEILFSLCVFRILGVYSPRVWVAGVPNG